MSKKTLNESIVRRLMGLANIQPTVVSNYIKENYNEEKDLEELRIPQGDEAKAAKKAHIAQRKDPKGDRFAAYDQEDYMQEEAMHSDEEKKEGMYGEEDEDPADAEAPPEDMGMPEPEEMDAGSPELEITKEEAAVLAAVLQKLTAAMPGEEAEAPMDAMDAPEGDEPEAELPPPGGEEGEEAPPEEEMLEQELSADDVVQEVARRVASRILKAKEAKQKMDKALGNDKK